MRTVKGHYNGSIVVLDEPPLDQQASEVTVQFPEGLAEGTPAGLPPIPSPEEWQQRVAILETVLNEWVADDSGYDEETWPELKLALDRNRAVSGDARSLFREVTVATENPGHLSLFVDADRWSNIV